MCQRSLDAGQLKVFQFIVIQPRLREVRISEAYLAAYREGPVRRRRVAYVGVVYLKVNRTESGHAGD